MALDILEELTGIVDSPAPYNRYAMFVNNLKQALKVNVAVPIAISRYIALLKEQHRHDALTDKWLNSFGVGVDIDVNELAKQMYEAGIRASENQVKVNTFGEHVIKLFIREYGHTNKIQAASDRDEVTKLVSVAKACQALLTKKAKHFPKTKAYHGKH